MQTHEFFKKYASTPLDKRFEVISLKGSGLMTLDEIYKRVHEIQDELRPKHIEQQKLIDIAEWFWSKD